MHAPTNTHINKIVVGATTGRPPKERLIFTERTSNARPYGCTYLKYRDNIMVINNNYLKTYFAFG